MTVYSVQASVVPASALYICVFALTIYVQVRMCSAMDN